jgi:hypothetical protein
MPTATAPSPVISPTGFGELLTHVWVADSLSIAPAELQEEIKRVLKRIANTARAKAPDAGFQPCRSGG